MVEPERLQAIWRMNFACWISKATREKTQARKCMHLPTHTEKNVILKAFPHQKWFRKSVPIVRYTYTASLVITDVECVYCAVRTVS